MESTKNKKILFITNFNGKEDQSDLITNFSMSSYLASKKLGYSFGINTNREMTNPSYPDIKHYKVEIYRNPFSRDVIKAYKQLDKVLNEETFDIIHCNTPIGGVLGRICGSKHKVNKIIYEAHGFHFYRGAPIFNWLIYYPIEKFLARKTDILITINKEDYQISKKFHIKRGGKLIYIPGVGVNTEKFKSDKNSIARANEIRKKENISEKDFVCVCVGRLDSNKNVKCLIDSFKYLPDNIHLLVCGDGVEKENLINLANSINKHNQIHFLGNRNDMADIYECADMFLMASYREGLSRSIIEAMSSGLPCAVSNIRGNRDLIVEGENGYLVNPDDSKKYSECILDCLANKEKREKYKSSALVKSKRYDINEIVNQLVEIYGD